MYDSKDHLTLKSSEMDIVPLYHHAELNRFGVVRPVFRFFYPIRTFLVRIKSKERTACFTCNG